jgi:hypothetical protein
MQARDGHTLPIPMLKYRCICCDNVESNEFTWRGDTLRVASRYQSNKALAIWLMPSNILASVPQISIDYYIVRLTHAAW